LHMTRPHQQSLVSPPGLYPHSLWCFILYTLLLSYTLNLCACVMSLMLKCKRPKGEYCISLFF
jgi:hypothetical protein